MKNMKKFVAIATAATLALVPMTAFAAQNNLDPSNEDPIQGDVNYVNTTIYQVTLPTTTGMTFALDPQGLTALDNSGDPADEAGKIVATGEMEAINESSVELKLQASFYIVDSTGTLTLVDQGDTVEDTEQQIQLVIQADPDADADGASDAGSYADALWVTGTTAEEPSTYEATMAAATYEFGGTAGNYTYDLQGDASHLFMQITGTVAKDYDWSAYTADSDPATINLHAVFKFVDEAAEPEVPAPTDDYKFILNQDGTASYTFVTKPSTDATGITAIADQVQTRTAAISSGNVTYDAETGTVTIKKAAVDSWAAAATTITATINGEEFEFTIVNPFTINVTAGQDATFTFAEGTAPEGSLTAIADNVQDRAAAVSSGNVTYDAETGTITIKQTAVDSWAKSATKITVTIGSNTYVFAVKVTN